MPDEIPAWKQKIIDADKKAAAAGDAAIADDLARIQANIAKIEAHGVPDTTDQETYDKLIAAVKQATAQNMTIAQFEQTVRNLGEKAVSLAGTLAKMA